MEPDQFFPADQQRRQSRLMADWRRARDQGIVLSGEAQGELEKLVESELAASGKRAAAILADRTPSPDARESADPE